MRQLALRSGPWTPEEKHALFDYCESDAESLARLLPAMASKIDIERALLRGRYMKAAAHIEHTGIPIDTTALSLLRVHWTDIQDELITRIDSHYGVYDGRTFKSALFADYLMKKGIPWLRLTSGALDLSDDAFREMARSHPVIAPLRELRTALSQMRLSDLPVGRDGRNRTLLSAFRARTGRNQPSNTKFIFGPAVWLRGLIRPEPGFGLAYIDWSQQEFGIAAALSQDPLMMEAYRSGDPYLAFAKQAGAVPTDATKQSHRAQREQFKACVLAVQYGMGEVSLSHRIGQPVVHARELLRLHHETYRTFWKWSDSVVDYAMLHGRLWTTFGWNVFTGTNPNPRFLRNFPMQANGAEMLRLACCFAVEAGVKVCAPVHDAILIEAPMDELEYAICTTQALMADVSALVLDGFRLRSDAKVIKHPERYMAERGTQMWDTVWDILRDRTPCAPVHTICARVHIRTILYLVGISKKTMDPIEPERLVLITKKRSERAKKREAPATQTWGELSEGTNPMVLDHKSFPTAGQEPPACIGDLVPGWPHKKGDCEAFRQCARGPRSRPFRSVPRPQKA
jgi:DNA polymerase I